MIAGAGHGGRAAPPGPPPAVAGQGRHAAPADIPSSAASRAHRVLGVRRLTEGTFVLRLARDGLDFQPGQWINLCPPGSRERREYTIYSGTGDPFLEVLVKEIPEGAVSPLLGSSGPGDLVEVDGPHGGFLIAEEDRPERRFLFIATGTGISPFHCFSASCPGLDYLLLHGVRTGEELYEHGAYEPGRAVACVSRSEGTYRGRVTGWVRDHETPPGWLYYACGNSDMIYEAFSILRSRGVPRSHMFAEVYF